MLAVVAGSSLALFAVLTKGFVVLLGRQGFDAVLRAPEFYAWTLAALAGMIFQQSAFRCRRCTWPSRWWRRRRNRRARRNPQRRRRGSVRTGGSAPPGRG
ncbi:hypothetical protein I552_3349 [Mycobacterium xenopi 3993]|nr:hypothetical protein I552_3349 [Mycobacterium xenopi 3993]